MIYRMGLFFLRIWAYIPVCPSPIQLLLWDLIDETLSIGERANSVHDVDVDAEAEAWSKF